MSDFRVQLEVNIRYHEVKVLLMIASFQGLSWANPEVYIRSISISVFFGVMITLSIKLDLEFSLEVFVRFIFDVMITLRST